MHMRETSVRKRLGEEQEEETMQPSEPVNPAPERALPRPKVMAATLGAANLEGIPIVTDENPDSARESAGSEPGSQEERTSIMHSREPILTTQSIGAIVAATLALAVNFGLDLDSAGVESILTLTSVLAPVILAAVYGRSKVSPVEASDSSLRR